MRLLDYARDVVTTPDMRPERQLALARLAVAVSEAVPFIKREFANHTDDYHHATDPAVLARLDEIAKMLEAE